MAFPSEDEFYDILIKASKKTEAYDADFTPVSYTHLTLLSTFRSIGGGIGGAAPLLLAPFIIYTLSLIHI